MSHNGFPRLCSYATLLLSLAAPSALAQSVWRVDADAAPGGDGLTWSTAFNDLQDALDLSNTTPGKDEIWVAEGVYIPSYLGGQTEQRTRHFPLHDSLRLYGGFDGTETHRDQRNPAENITVLDGDRSQDDAGGFANRGDNVYLVLHCDFAVAGLDGFDSEIDGFTIKGGHNTDNSLFRESGGAHFRGHGNLVIRRCEFRENYGENSGALWIQPSNSEVFGTTSVLIEDCRFVRNVTDASGGGLEIEYGDESYSVVEGCEFIDNDARRSGGGAFVRGATSQTGLAVTAVVRDSLFESNTTREASGGGLSAVGHVGVKSCRFLRNRAGTSPSSTFQATGGGLSIAGRPDLSAPVVQCLFANNRAARGGGIAIGGESFGASAITDLRNCTLYRNRADVSGGAVYLTDNVELVVISNSLLWANQAPSKPEIDDFFVLAGPSELEVLWSNVQGGVEGAGCISAEPGFVDPLGPDGVLGTVDDDYRPSGWSPCVDAGLSALVPLGVFADLGGAPRVVGLDVDIGAYELSDVAFGRPVCATTIDDVDCPCSNDGLNGAGCSNTVGGGARLAPTGSPFLGTDDVVLHVSDGPALQPGIVVQGNAYQAVPWKDGVLCAGGSTERLEVVFFDGTGALQSSVPLAAAGQVSPGDERIYQLWYRNAGGPCATGSNFSNALEVVWQ